MLNVPHLPSPCSPWTQASLTAVKEAARFAHPKSVGNDDVELSTRYGQPPGNTGMGSAELLRTAAAGGGGHGSVHAEVVMAPPMLQVSCASSPLVETQRQRCTFVESH